MTTEEAVNRRFTLIRIPDISENSYILIDHFHLTEGPVMVFSEEEARQIIANRLWGTSIPVDDPENKIGLSATDVAKLVRISTV